MLLFDVLEPLRGLLLVDDRLTLSVLDILEDLFVGLTLLFVFGLLFLQLEFHELLLLLEDCLVLLPPLVCDLQVVLQRLQVRLELADSLRSCGAVFLGGSLELLHLLGVLLL